MKKREFLIRYFFYLALACCIFYKGEYIGQWAYYVSNIFIKCALFFVFAIVFFILLAVSLFIKAENKIYVIRKICKVYLPIVLLPFIYLLVRVVFTPSIIFETSFLTYYLLIVLTILLILDILLNIEYIYYEQYFYYVINILPCILFCFNKNIDFESDSPIQNSHYDILDRTEFIDILKRKFMNIDKEKGFAFLLSGGWGEGKTSCINLLKEQLREENLFEFIDINPWFNDTKEKLLNAILGEINNFAKNFYPYKSFESDFDDIIKLANIKLTSHVEIALQNILDNFTKDNNIQHKIKNIGNILKNEYSKRIVIVLDDIDRLSKEHILYILQVVQMFKQYTSIIFVLSADYNKIENILCEISEPCININGVKNNDTESNYRKNKDIKINNTNTNLNNNISIKKTLYYKNYLEKIASVIIQLPKIEDIEIENILFKKINYVLKEEQMPTINKTDFNFYIATSRFKTIRDVKRFCNTFLISYAQVKNEVNVFNYINISILFVFYPELYNNAWNNKYKWFKLKVNIHDDKQLVPIKQYFKDIVEKYDEEDIENIKELITLISPVYEQIPAEEGKNYLKMANKEAKSYFLDDRYLQYYFTQNFSENRIPDKILDKKIQDFFDEKDEKIREKDILRFMMEYKFEISDIFRYLNIYYDDKYSNLFRQIILVFSKNAFVLIQDFSDVVEYIYKIIVVSRKYKVMDVNNFLMEIIENASSVSFAMELYEKFSHDEGWLLDVNNINNILDEKISKNIEKTLESFESVQYIRYLYLWLQKYFTKSKNIIDLDLKDYISIRKKVKKVLPYIKNNIYYFMTFIGQYLEQSIKEFNNDNSFESRFPKSFMYYIDIWGKDTISSMLTGFLNNGKGMNYDSRIVKLNELYRIALLDEKIKQIVEEHEKKVLPKIAIYDLVKDLDIRDFQNVETFNDFSGKFSYTGEKVKYFVEIKDTSNFDASLTNKLIDSLKSKEKQILYFYFIVAVEDEKLKLEKELNKFVANLGNKELFMFKVETQKNLLEKY